MNKMTKEDRYRYNLKYRNNNKDKIKNSKLIIRYNINLDDYNNLLLKQNFKCAICTNILKEGRSTHVDHCHSSKRVRGLLCNKCNLALGLLKDNISSLDRIFKYLTNN